MARNSAKLNFVSGGKPNRAKDSGDPSNSSDSSFQRQVPSRAPSRARRSLSSLSRSASSACLRSVTSSVKITTPPIPPVLSNHGRISQRTHCTGRSGRSKRSFSPRSTSPASARRWASFHRSRNVGENLVVRHATQFAVAQAKVSLPAAADMEVAHLAVKHRQCRRCVLDEKPEPLLALSQRFFFKPTFGDVAGNL